MANSYAVFAGSIPEAYDRHLGPMIIDPHASDLAQRVRVGPSAHVLELACGTGILTRHLLANLPQDAHVVATDLYPPMFEYAKRAVGPNPRVEWQAADATRLPFPDGMFEAVACQFGIMFFPDKPMAVREAHRVLVHGGQLVFNTWDSFDHNPPARVAHEVAARLFPENPPDFLSIPYGFHDIDRIGTLVQHQGFRDVQISTVERTTEVPTARDAATGFVRGTPLINLIRERDPSREDKVVEAVAAEIAQSFGDRPARIPSRSLAVTARRDRPPPRR
jgi:SAM-dependent methyltransferase